MPDKHTVTFSYHSQAIAFNYWTHTNASQTIDTVIFLGTSQIGAIPRWVAALAPPGVAVVEGLPHWKADATGKDLKEFSQMFTTEAFLAVLDAYQLDAAHLIAMSQAAPGALWMAAALPAKIRNMSLVGPLGLTKSAFGKTEVARLRALKKRAVRSLLQQMRPFFFSPRNFYIFLSLLRVRFLETDLRGSDRKYAEGLSHDLLAECHQILANQMSKNGHFFVFVGDKDIIFPYSEIRHALDSPDLKQIRLITLPNTSHTSFTASRDRAALHEIVTTTRSA